MGRKFETAAVEVVYAYAVASVLIWGVAAGIVLLVGLPQVFVFPLLQVAALIASAFFALMSG